MRYTKIYCGSNNETGILELDTIEDILSTAQAGYTITTGKGYYKGKKELTAIIEIYGNYNTGIIPELKRVLKQDSLLVAEFIAVVNFYD